MSDMPALATPLSLVGGHGCQATQSAKLAHGYLQIKVVHHIEGPVLVVFRQENNYFQHCSKLEKRLMLTCAVQQGHSDSYALLSPYGPLSYSVNGRLGEYESDGEAVVDLFEAA